MGFRNSTDNVKAMNFQRIKLLSILRENRAKHKEQYEKAKKGFQDEIIREAEDVIKKAKRGIFNKTALTTVGFAIRVPEEHIEEYDQAIRMLELCIDEMIEIDGFTFGCYVMDKWTWSDSFVSNTMEYARKFDAPKKRRK